MEIHNYFYPEIGIQQNYQASQKILNLNSEIAGRIAKKLGLRFASEKEEDIQENSSPVCYANSDEVTEDFKIELPPLTFAPIDILDYIYAILYSSTYREKYKEFFKEDFPQIPYPKSQFTFWQLVKLGKELRQIHLLQCSVVEKLITKYPVSGNNVVGEVLYEDGRVYINYYASSSPSGIEGLQYFENVPEVAWDFYMDGYQPAQKWLKDRIGKELSLDDILRYQKIIVALMETQRIIKEIDKIKID
jgi:predicted helicase